MVAGAPVFNAPSLMGVLARHITEPPPPLPVEANVPPALASVVMRALEKDPAARPADATDLARELRAAEEKESRQSEAAQAAQAAEAERQRRATAEQQQ